MAIIEEAKDLNEKSKDYLANVFTLEDILKPIFGDKNGSKEVCNVRKESEHDSTRNER